MIIRKQPLVKLLELADQAYLDNPLPAGPGHPFIYSERVLFKCFAYEIENKRLLGWCLAGLGSVAVGQGKLEEAAYFYGAAERLLGEAGVRLEPISQRNYEQAEDRLRTSLEPATFKAVWAKGRDASFAQIISLTLNQKVLTHELL